MEYQGGFETFREATRYMFRAPSLFDVLFVLMGLSLAVGFLIVFPYLWSRYRARMDLRKEFFNMGKSMGLDGEEILLLWKCANITREPVKIMQTKAVFERCISKLVKEDSSKIEMVAQIRRKLRFDSLPWFLPLNSTKDIDLYQTGFITYEGHAYSSAVWEKNELELHIAMLDGPAGPIQPGGKVKFSFLREGDGRYYFQGDILRTYRDGTKLVLVLPHTDQLSKIQLRESLRWRVRIPARIHIYRNNSLLSLEEPEDTIEGTIEDLSVQGVRVCLSGFVEVKGGEKVYLNFELKSYPIRTLGTVKNVRGGVDRTCLGIKFENLSKTDEDYIRKFIIEEQRELLRTYKMGEPKEGSSS
ncbi:MAG: PilZ domain-containing protein [Aquificaceae bacterium]|jgi:c-di-GMP-binding flagellar brake protein YcgR|uniref:flagellar brake protein n=1 Tax=Hydrogenobacter sp. Uz 6-8 TaxID=3384828 RepID=UPI000F18B3A6|nr:MAG: PilZ domain-containing protein [Aquificota bacterium]